MGGVDAASTGETKPVALQAIAFVAFASGNMGLNLFNSWALRNHEGVAPSWDQPSFDFPVFYTMWHMLVSAFAAMLLMCTVARPATGLPNFTQFWEYKIGLISISACTFLNNGLNNMSLTMVSLFTNQVIKATLPFWLMIFSFVLAKKTYGPMIIGSVLALVVGSVLSNASSFGSSSGQSTSLVGVIICVISLMASAVKPVVAMMVMAGTPDRPKLAPNLVLFYDTGISFFFMLTYWLCSNEREGSYKYVTGSSLQSTLTLTIILCGSSMAFIFNIANYYFVMLTSALTSGIAANSIKIVLIIIAAIQASIADPLSWTGIAIVILAILGYAYLSIIAKAPPKPPADVEKATPILTKTEETPLKQ